MIRRFKCADVFGDTTEYVECDEKTRECWVIYEDGTRESTKHISIEICTAFGLIEIKPE